MNISRLLAILLILLVFEARYTANGLKRIARQAVSGTRCIYLHSNHDRFLNRFLDAGEKYWTQNYNYELCVKLQQQRMSSPKQPIEHLIDFADCGFEFWPDSEPFRLGGVAILHGHQTVSGRRVGFMEMAKHFNMLSMNHLHSPQEFRNAVCGGLTGIKNMAYTEGSLSGWLHSNTIIHADSSMQLVTTIDGVWRV